MDPVPLSTERLELSVPTLDDAEAIARICQQPEVSAWTTVPHPYRIEDAQAFITKFVAEGWESGHNFTWAVRLRADDGTTTLIGMAGAGGQNGTAELGWWLDSAHTGKGYMTEAMRAVMDWAFSPDGGNREHLTWSALAGNWPSRRIAWKLGFLVEGELRGTVFQKGRRCDEWKGTLLREDAREPNEAWPEDAPTPIIAIDPDNPFLKPSGLPYELPDFEAIRIEHYAQATKHGIGEEKTEIADIVANEDEPTTENTLEALERSGQTLKRAAYAFYNLISADATDELQDIDEELSPLLSAHHDDIYLDAGLHARIQRLNERVESGEVEATSADRRLIETWLRDFRRAGINLSDDEQQQLRALNATASSLSTELGKLMLKGANDGAVLITDPADLEGLDESEIEAAREAAKERGHGEGYLVELELPTSQGVLGSLRHRPTRERVMKAALNRGATDDDTDTRAKIIELVQVRAERAKLLGYDNHAAYSVEDATAQTTQAVDAMLGRLAPAAVANARAESLDIVARLAEDNPDATPEPWDWSYYAEQVRAAKYDFDEGQLRPYLELDRVLHDGVFYAAGRLYGLRFELREDLKGYHPDVRVWEVFDEDGTAIGLFLGDFFTRSGKHGGAWMNNLVDQNHLLGQKAIVVNNLNVVKPAAGEPALISWDNVITMFHEFGHALHGLFSDTHYPSQSGTNVPRDFVEFPSQVNEMWAWHPQILSRYAIHHKTGDVMPQELVDKILHARQFNEGFSTTEYLGAALLDQAWHRLTPENVPAGADDVLGFEAQALADAGVDFDLVPPRYRTTYFQHIFVGGYSAAYYAYIWSEVLDADTVRWFEASGGLSRDNGDRFRQVLLSVGDSQDPMAAVRELLGRDPDISALLARRGLEAA